MYVTPYHIFWIRFTLKLELRYTDTVMGENYASLVACNNRDFMVSLSIDNQADIIEAFGSTLIFNINNP